jgi:hypothetical protein
MGFIVPAPRRGQQVRIEGNQWLRFPVVGNEQPSGNVRVVWPSDRVPAGVLLAPPGRVVTSDLIEGLRLYRVGSEDVTRDELVERIEARDRAARVLKQQEVEAKEDARRRAENEAAARERDQRLLAADAASRLQGAEALASIQADLLRESKRVLAEELESEAIVKRRAYEAESARLAEGRAQRRADIQARDEANAVALQEEKLRALGLVRSPGRLGTVSVGR